MDDVVCLTVSAEVVEPVMPTTLPLSALFNIRPVYMVTEDEDDRLSNIYWLSTPMGDESDHEQDLVCTLLPVYQTYHHVYCLAYLTKPPSRTQPGHPSMDRRNEYWQCHCWGRNGEFCVTVRRVRRAGRSGPAIRLKWIVC